MTDHVDSQSPFDAERTVPAKSKAPWIGFAVGAALPVIYGIYGVIHYFDVAESVKPARAEMYLKTIGLLTCINSPCFGIAGASVAAIVAVIGRQFKTNAAFIGFAFGAAWPVCYGILALYIHREYVNSLGPNEAACGMSVLGAYLMMFVVAPVLGIFGALTAAIVVDLSRRYQTNMALLGFEVGAAFPVLYGFDVLTHIRDDRTVAEMVQAIHDTQIGYGTIVVAGPLCGVIGALVFASFAAYRRRVM